MKSAAPTEKVAVKRASNVKAEPLTKLPNELPVAKMLAQKFKQAKASGKWMVAIWRVSDGQLHLDRMAVNFPRGDIDAAMQLIVANVQLLKTE